MTVNKLQKSRVADLEAKQAADRYVPPIIVIWSINPDQTCDRVIIQSGPFRGCEFNPEIGETYSEFDARVCGELAQMDKEIADRVAY